VFHVVGVRYVIMLKLNRDVPHAIQNSASTTSGNITVLFVLHIIFAFITPTRMIAYLVVDGIGVRMVIELVIV